MDAFKSKSDINKLAADVLSDKHLYAPAVNCIYYSCLQFTIHLLVKKGGYSEERISHEISMQGGGSHGFYINKTCDFITKIDTFAANKLRRSIGKLKKLREDAEYKSVMINTDIHQSAQTYYNEIFSILKKQN